MPEGSCELRSALSSVLPGSFLEIGLFLVLGAHIEVSMAEPIFFFKKNRSRRNGQKQPKNWVFGLFRKIYLLVLSVNDVE